MLDNISPLWRYFHTTKESSEFPHFGVSIGFVQISAGKSVGVVQPCSRGIDQRCERFILCGKVHRNQPLTLIHTRKLDCVHVLTASPSKPFRVHPIAAPHLKRICRQTQPLPYTRTMRSLDSEGSDTRTVPYVVLALGKSPLAPRCAGYPVGVCGYRGFRPQHKDGGFPPRQPSRDGEHFYCRPDN